MGTTNNVHDKTKSGIWYLYKTYKVLRKRVVNNLKAKPTDGRTQAVGKFSVK